MKTSKTIPIVIICSSLALSACENAPKQAMGSIVGGGALGGAGYFLSKGIKGGKYTAPITVASAALGALVGGGIGSALDKTDQMHHLATTQIALETLPTDTPKQWNNPKTDNSGVIVPRKTYKKASGEWCRKYDYHIMHDTKVSSGKGLACRNEKTGKWDTIGTPSLSTL